MASIFVQAPTDQVFDAMCDLTQHAKWAAHDIAIQAGQEGPPAVGNSYTCSHKGKAGDQVTITEIAENQQLGFHVVMPNKWELDWSMAVTPQGEGTLVTRDGKITKMPALMAPMKLVVALVAPRFEKKFLNNMKEDLESAG